jgi:hypothetical protein
MRISIAALAIALHASTPALAACSWTWLCNGEGACRQMPVCDSVYETPPPRPESRPPVAPPLTTRPFTLSATNRSALTCEHIMRQDASGRWSWEEACFCTDKSKNPDPSSPFGNIVRCDDPRATASAASGR